MADFADTAREREREIEIERDRFYEQFPTI
jgi:hypothetical protein